MDKEVVWWFTCVLFWQRMGVALFGAEELTVTHLCLAKVFLLLHGIWLQSLPYVDLSDILVCLVFSLVKIYVCVLVSHAVNYC